MGAFCDRETIEAPDSATLLRRIRRIEQHELDQRRAVLFKFIHDAVLYHKRNYPTSKQITFIHSYSYSFAYDNIRTVYNVKRQWMQEFMAELFPAPEWQVLFYGDTSEWTMTVAWYPVAREFKS